jgi:dolichyl-phosphate-mannose--protein O-mannosyl transferase
VVFFVVIPATIYTLSYLPYAAADPNGKSLLQTMWDNQVFMLTYHQGVHDAHPYSSRWWQWILDIRPILYYLDSTTVGEGMKSAFAAFGNPLVVWGGLLAECSLVWAAVRRHSGRAAFLLVGWLAQLVPWIFISRTTFEYHYFPSILFLVLALVFVMNELWEKPNRWTKPAIYGFTGLSVALFPAFYPVLTGLPAPTWYTTHFLQWFPSWPF